MKTRLFVGAAAIAVALLAGGWLLGDDKKPDDKDAPKVKGQLPRDFKKLGLSDKQIQDIYKIEATYHDQISTLQQKIDDLKKAEHDDVDNVLTDEQKAHLKEIRTADIPTKDKPAPAPDKDKTVTIPEKDKPIVVPPDKDKTVTIPEKDKSAPPKDK